MISASAKAPDAEDALTPAKSNRDRGGRSHHPNFIRHLLVQLALDYFLQGVDGDF